MGGIRSSPVSSLQVEAGELQILLNYISLEGYRKKVKLLQLVLDGKEMQQD